jgi:plasmid stabilization system protein ParE
MYTLSFSSSFFRDVHAACEYIDSTLQNPIAAANLLDELEQFLRYLKQSPLSHPLVRDAYLASCGFRMLMIKNYMLFYKVDLENKIVAIHRFLHGSRNWQEIL